MSAQNLLSNAIDKLKAAEGDPDVIVELEEVWQAMDGGYYSTGEVAALVEEIKAKTYDGVKARVLSLLEALLQVRGMGDSPAGRVLDILLRDVDRQITDTAAKHVPEITAAALDKARHQRELADADGTVFALAYRARELKEQAEVAERLLQEFNQKADRKRRSRALSILESDPSPETVDAVMAVLESMDKPHS